MSVLVCGGAGYIGSHTVAELLSRGEEVVIVDNLTKGHKEALLGGKLCVGDIRDPAFLQSVFKENPQIESVIDFAAHIEVGESMKDPLAFYDNNVYSVVQLVKAMNAAGVKRIVFLLDGGGVRPARDRAHPRDLPQGAYQRLWRKQAGRRGPTQMVRRGVRREVHLPALLQRLRRA